jgi:outer membrane autotransporter protein
MTMTRRIGTGFEGHTAALPGALLAAALVLMSPAHAQTRPPAGGLSPFEQAFLNYLTSTASTAFCVTQSDLGTSTTASSNCNIARSYAFGNNVTGSQLRGLIPNQLSGENSQFKDFAGSQFHDLASRLSAIRAGASGFMITAAPAAAGFGPALASGAGKPEILGGAASADEPSADFSRWGGFFNTTYDWGHRSATDSENALHSNAYELTLGADYRATRGLVVGGILGFAADELSFNDSSNIVGGTLHTRAYSLMVYAQQEWENAYVSASLGDQTLHQDLSRTGIFDDPATSYSAPFRAAGSTGGQSVLAALSAGYDAHFKAFTVEPYLSWQYRRTRIDGFQEHGASGTESNGFTNYDINMRFDPRTVISSQGTVALKVQYAMTPAFGVLVPFLDAGFTHEFNESPYNVTGTFAGLYNSVPNFFLAADKPSRNFVNLSGGLTFVFKHGVQGYLRYRQVLDQRYVTDHAVGAGFRVEL